MILVYRSSAAVEYSLYKSSAPMFCFEFVPNAMQYFSMLFIHIIYFASCLTP